MNTNRLAVLGAAVLLCWRPSIGGADSSAFGYEAWAKEVAARGVDPSQAVYPFHATEAMRQWATDRLVRSRPDGPSKRLETLQHELFNQDAFEFSYEDAMTLTAREAFEARRGNCMAFTSMFVALSRSVGIRTFLVKVRRAPEVDRADSLVVVNRHVVAGFHDVNEMSLFDFYVTSSAPYVQHWVIDDVQASAMYHTNLGGAAIRNNDLALAMFHLDIATRLDESWAPGWVNLGVARFRAGELDSAMQAYEQALVAEPGNSSALTNMALIYRARGMEDEARNALLAAAEGRSNPFTLIAMADMEARRGDLDAAERYLRRARWWYRDEPEVYDALAKLSRRRGDQARADRHAERAAEIRRQQGTEHDLPLPVG